MPEGDTLFRAAAGLRKALLHRTVTRFTTSEPTVATALENLPVEGRVITSVEAKGKNLLITFSLPEDADPALATRDVVLHTHLRMTGSWHIYRPGEAWRKPNRYAKVVIYTEAFVAPCFSAPVVQLLTARQAERLPQLQALGPDAMTEEFDVEAAVQRLQRHPDVEIAVALLNQRNLAGVGNIYKSEVLFVQRVSPFRKVRELDEPTLRGLVELAHRLLRVNENRGERRTRFGLRENQRLWVYGRSGERCYVCGSPIRMRRQGMDARSTYYCAICQH